MNPLKVFVSHSHAEREVAVSIKEELGRFGCDAFVAHEDIQPTADWPKVILDRLRACDVFLALLSESFSDSDWTDQETGIALALDKVIVPIKMNHDPYGFIANIQAMKWDVNNLKVNQKKLVRLLFERKQLTLEALIHGFAESHSYEDAALNVEILWSGLKFSKTQIEEIVKASILNIQIHRSFRAAPLLNQLFSKYSDIVDSELLKKWRS